MPGPIQYTHQPCHCQPTSSGPKERAGLALVPDSGASNHVSMAKSGGLTNGVKGWVVLCAAQIKISMTSRKVQTASPATGNQPGTPLAGKEAPHVTLAPVALQTRSPAAPSAAPASWASSRQSAA